MGKGKWKQREALFAASMVHLRERLGATEEAEDWEVVNAASALIDVYRMREEIGADMKNKVGF